MPVAKINHTRSTSSAHSHHRVSKRTIERVSRRDRILQQFARGVRGFLVSRSISETSKINVAVTATAFYY